MGIRLDWQVESEQSRVRATEDPDARQARRRAQRRLLWWLLALAGVLALAGGAALWRLQRIENQLRQDLLDTVEIEVSALRIGNRPNFMAVQRSASETFLMEQSYRFEDYQTLKQTHRVELPGDVLDVTIDRQRGRAMVREVIDGVPYKVLWFYWYYEDGRTSNRGGWRHVPDDLTFWGDEAHIERGPVRVDYRELDEPLAQALTPRLESWWVQGCVWLGCEAPPPLRVAIVAERPAQVMWSETQPWTLRISSPLVGRARADVALAPDLEGSVAELVAGRLVRFAAGEAAPLSYSDAAWLQMELAVWLADRFLERDSTPLAAPGFVMSLVAQHGTGAPAAVLGALRGGTTLEGAVAAASGVPMAQLSVDQLDALGWASFFEWRLALEARLLYEPEQQSVYLALYDPDDAYATNTALRRWETRSLEPLDALRVTGVTITRDASGQTYAYVAIAHERDGAVVPGDTVLWRFSGGTWRRTN